MFFSGLCSSSLGSCSSIKEESATGVSFNCVLGSFKSHFKGTCFWKHVTFCWTVTDPCSPFSGYRHIHLLSKDGTAIPPASIFVNVSISELTWTTQIKQEVSSRRCSKREKCQLSKVQQQEDTSNLSHLVLCLKWSSFLVFITIYLPFVDKETWLFCYKRRKTVSDQD